MGVPGFFIWLIKKYKNIITYKLDNNIDILYLDANCLVHPQTQKVLKKIKNWENKDYIEEKMLDEIELYIDYLVNSVNPTKMLYIAIDGVAPCAKIKHQRMRRFKSIKYRDQVNSLKKKHGIKLDKKWDNASITPGTEFMMKITNRILKIVNENKYGNLKIIFSSGGTPGEGEHKILQHINKLPDNNNIVIYGLDADLIFLAMASHKNNIYLLREVQHFGKNSIKKNTNLVKSSTDDSTDESSDDSSEEEPMEELNYLDIDILRNRLYEEITNKIKININPSIYNIINDFIFISYFIGNDFLPNIPSIDIKTKGLDILLEAYINTLNLLNVDKNTLNLLNVDKNTNLNHFLLVNNKNVTINNIFLKTFLQYLSVKEEDYFKNNYRRPNRNRRCFVDDPFEKDKFNLDNLQFYIKDPIKLGKDTPELWKKRYYKHYFNIDNTEDVYNICKKYLEGVLWTSRYYLDECCSWEWYYPYTHAPMISDLYNFYINNTDFTDEIIFKKSKPLDPFIQLLSVLHPSCNYLLPQKLRYLMINNKSPIIDLYPYRFTEDLIGKNMLWKAIPILPNLDIQRIKKNVKYKYIDSKDMDRNKKIDIFKNY